MYLAGGSKLKPLVIIYYNIEWEVHDFQPEFIPSISLSPLEPEFLICMYTILNVIPIAYRRKDIY